MIRMPLLSCAYVNCILWQEFVNLIDQPIDQVDKLLPENVIHISTTQQWPANHWQQRLINKSITETICQFINESIPESIYEFIK